MSATSHLLSSLAILGVVLGLIGACTGASTLDAIDGRYEWKVPPQPNRLTAPAVAGSDEALALSYLNKVFVQNVLGPSAVKIVQQAAKAAGVRAYQDNNLTYGAARFEFFEIGPEGASVDLRFPHQVILTLRNITLMSPKTTFRIGKGTESLLAKKESEGAREVTAYKREEGVCDGHYYVKIERASVEISLLLSQNTTGNSGQLLSNVSVAFGRQYESQVPLEFSKERRCEVPYTLLESLHRKLTSAITDALMTAIPTYTAAHIVPFVDGMFSRIPLFFTNVPLVISESLLVATVDLLATTAPRSVDSYSLKEFLASSQLHEPRELTLSVPAAAINNMTSFAQREGKLDYLLVTKHGDTSIFKNVVPNAYFACPDCPIVMAFNFSSAPRMAIKEVDAEGKGGVQGTVQRINVMFFGSSNIKSTDRDDVPLFSMNANISFVLNQLTVRPTAGDDGTMVEALFFHITVNTMDFSAGDSVVGPLPSLDVLAPVVTHCVQDLAIPTFNADFKGVRLPAGLSGAEVKSYGGFVELTSDLS